MREKVFPMGSYLSAVQFSVTNFFSQDLLLIFMFWTSEKKILFSLGYLIK